MEILTEIGDLQIGTIEKVILILLVAAIFNLEKILIVLDRLANHWTVDKKFKDNNFYIRVFLGSMFVGAIIGCIWILGDYYKTPFVIRCACLIVLWGISLLFINGRETVKLGVLHESRIVGVLLINFPIVLFTIAILAMYYEKVTLETICMLLLILCEFRGLYVFSSSYTIYSNSYVDVVLANSEKICGIDVDKIKKKGKWLIIDINKTKRILLFDNVIELNYYGEPKYVLGKLDYIKDIKCT